MLDHIQNNAEEEDDFATLAVPCYDLTICCMIFCQCRFAVVIGGADWNVDNDDGDGCDGITTSSAVIFGIWYLQ